MFYLILMRTTVSKQHSRVARQKIVAPLFFTGPSPVETGLGESPASGRRTGLDDDLRNGTLPLGRSVEEAWLQDR